MMSVIAFVLYFGKAPLATQCLELLHHLRATHDLLEATRGKLASKQIDVSVCMYVHMYLCTGNL
jgi:hypothetical protein